jgi:hypothetical protein
MTKPVRLCRKRWCSDWHIQTMSRTVQSCVCHDGPASVLITHRHSPRHVQHDGSHHERCAKYRAKPPPTPHAHRRCHPLHEPAYGCQSRPTPHPHRDTSRNHGCDEGTAAHAPISGRHVCHSSKSQSETRADRAGVHFQLYVMQLKQCELFFTADVASVCDVVPCAPSTTTSCVQHARIYVSRALVGSWWPGRPKKDEKYILIKYCMKSR